MHSPAPLVVVWHRDGILRSTLEACLRALRARAGGAAYELVVCDLGSRDPGGVARVAEAAGARLVRTATRDAAAGLNTALRARRTGQHLIRVRSDVLVETAGFVERVLTAFAGDPELGVVGGRLVAVDGRVRSEGRNPVGGLGVASRIANRRHFEADRAPGPDEDPMLEVDTVPGNFAAVRAETLDRVGGFDERFALEGAEDDDLCLAARFVGFRVAVDRGILARELSPAWSPTLGDPDKASRTGYGNKMLARRDEILWRAHRRPWLAKWGFDPQYPDLDEVRRLYGDTRICWRIGEPLRAHWADGAAPDVDVAVVTWNNRATLERCLRSLAATRWDGRVSVHVTDNGSRDGTLEMLESARAWFPFALHVHALPLNTGVTVGFNWSILAGRAELVARLDDDVVVPPDWLESLFETLRRRPFAGCVGPKILNDDDRRTIQCGPLRMFPGTFGHTDEEDRGQADYVARCTHVRGCCNLYRRDVLEECGLFDLRYSPSQWDDPDHHLALLARGYEILYDGRVGVVHALSTGKGRGWAAASNQAANRDKLDGKWGEDAWHVVERALDFSRIGRLLPDGPDAFRGPDPTLFPRTEATAGYDPDELDAARKLLSYEALATLPGGPLEDERRTELDHARYLSRHGLPLGASRLLGNLIDLCPAHPGILRQMVETWSAMAQGAEAGRYLDLLCALDPSTDRAAVVAEVEDVLARTRDLDPGDRSTEVGSPTPMTQRASAPMAADVRDPRPLRVLVANTFRARAAGGDMLQLKSVAARLRAAGVEVEVAHTAHPDPRGFDVVHVFNSWFPSQTLPQIKGLRARTADAPIAMTPIYWDMAEKNWAELAVAKIYDPARDPAQRAALLAGLADGSLVVDGTARRDAKVQPFPGFEDWQAEMFAQIDAFLPQSHAEMRLLRERFGLDVPCTVVPNGADPATFWDADPAAFRRHVGLPDGPDGEYVLTVGLLECRKNQLLLLEALRGSGARVVVVGRRYDPTYERACRSVADDRVVFVDHVPHELLASAMHGARVFALPSWMECAAISSLEAAMCGCPLVVGDRTSEREVLGDVATLCDPANVESIRSAVAEAWERAASPADRDRREAFRHRMLTEATWEKAAEHTLEGYARLLQDRGRGEAAAAAGRALERARDLTARVAARYGMPGTGADVDSLGMRAIRSP